MVRRMLTVHAHPDDEASRGAATVARYTAEGVRAILVTCTDGGAGAVLNSAVTQRFTPEEFIETRAAELSASARHLGYSAVHMLGYRDSGMDGAAGGDRAFCRVPIEEAADRLMRVMAEERPQVVVGYGTNHERDPHPDHIRANKVLTRAVELLDYSPAVYHVAFSRRRHLALHRACVERGVASPYEAGLGHAAHGFDDSSITTLIEVEKNAIARKLDALRSHVTQVPPDSGWFALSPEELREAFPYEEYIRVGAAPGNDLFDGIA
ncbi:PIG-L family deacetylase [Allokutzneria sp. A3M-2-11 16]|uniref:PIG-L family deacetylase n=1 Tax=Allokutzneria sp. A3M-2-11 16 TaxID=2962043 RepID=UPI0020B6815B|nr:PIG-L family deacetylase [Allokutzneria sp. A3M-2-11 16]MCP3801910.1 PIG-L family deacetylase [Allokutzneria sp. A3M-2-11 16]